MNVSTQFDAAEGKWPGATSAPPAIPAWVRRSAAVLVLSVCLLTVVGFGGAYSYISVPAYLLLYGGVCLLLGLSVYHGFALPWPSVMWPMLGFGVLVFAQWGGGWTATRGDTLAGLTQLSACGAAFYLAYVGFAEARWLRRLGTVLYWAAGVLAVEAVLQRFTAGGYIYWFHDATYADPMGPFVYYNHYAGCMDLLVPVAAAAIWAKASAGEEAWLRWTRRGLVPLLAVVSVVLSASRGGVMALLFEALVAAGLLYRRRRAPLRKLAAWGGLISLGLVLISVSASTLLARVAHVGPGGDVVQRLKVDESCLHMFLSRPWTGVGFNAFASVYPRYALFDTGLQWRHAHDEYAQLLAETGLLGLLCLLAVLVYFMRAGWRCRQRHAPRRRLRLALFIGMAGLACHSWVDFQFHEPAIALLFFLLAGAAMQEATTHGRAAGVPARLGANEAMPGTLEVR